MSHLAPPNQSQALQARLLAERREREWLQQRVTEMGQELAMARESSTNASPEKGDMLRTDDTCSPARSDGSSAASSTHSSPEVIELRSRLEMTETKHGNLLATLRVSSHRFAASGMWTTCLSALALALSGTLTVTLRPLCPAFLTTHSPDAGEGGVA